MDRSKKNNFPRVASGFTLIEFIIVIGIISIFTGLTIAYYNSFGDDYRLENEARTLSNALTLAQKKSSVGDDKSIQPTCAPSPAPNSFSGYRVTINSSTNYILQRECGSNLDTVQQYTISNPNIVITPPAGTATIRFLPLSNGVLPANNPRIRLKHTSSNKCIDVIVSPVGNVTEEKNPPAC